MLNENEFCDIETCITLKALGFNEDCIAYYDVDDNVGLLYNTYWSAGGPCQYFEVLQCHNTENNEEENFVDAPTIYQAQKWLRQNGVIVDHYNNFTTQEFKYYISTWDEDICTSNKYTSWEEALSDGIKEATKLIIEKRILLN
jgi:hypothetical protein